MAAMDPNAPVLTIDGPSGSGKGTISRLVAQRLGWHYLDSGALYRAVGVAAGWADLDLSDPGALVRCCFDSRIEFAEVPGQELRILVNGRDATDEIRTETAGAAASAIAAIPEVRTALMRCEYGRAASAASCARRSFAAATIFIALVIFCVALTEAMRFFSSLREGIRFQSYLPIRRRSWRSCPAQP